MAANVRRRGGGAMLGLAAAALLVACAPAADQEGGSGTAAGGSSLHTDGSSGPLSPSDLPTMPAPSAPPSAPTDSLPADHVAGRVSALASGCVEVTTEEGDVWSLTTESDLDLKIGDVVRAKVAPLDDAEEPCGTGSPAAATVVEVVD